jgi:hypothetical protein
LEEACGCGGGEGWWIEFAHDRWDMVLR